MGKDQFAKGGNLYLLPLAKGGWEGFYKDFQTAKVLRKKFFIFRLSFRCKPESRFVRMLFQKGGTS